MVNKCIKSANNLWLLAFSSAVLMNWIKATERILHTNCSLLTNWDCFRSQFELLKRLNISASMFDCLLTCLFYLIFLPASLSLAPTLFDSSVSCLFLQIKSCALCVSSFDGVFIFAQLYPFDQHHINIGWATHSSIHFAAVIEWNSANCFCCCCFYVNNVPLSFSTKNESNRKRHIIKYYKC